MTEFKKLSAEDIKALEAMMPGRVLSGEGMADDYDHDEMTEYGRFRPEAVLLAQSAQEVSGAMR